MQDARLLLSLFESQLESLYCPAPHLPTLSRIVTIDFISPP